MAGAKKKKKPASNPARGFATTSIASKPRVEQSDKNVEDAALAKTTPPSQGENGEVSTIATSAPKENAKPAQELSPEEFEKQLDETELQNLVEKHSQKAKREAARQATRLHTDRRILRSQAENLNTRKWLPAELMDTILDMIKTEGRANNQALGAEGASTKALSEEDLTIKLWTLQQTLTSSGFSEEHVKGVLRYILDISSKISSSNKDMIYGLEESLEWLAREVERDELPDYDGWQHKKLGHPASRSQNGECLVRFVTWYI
jgi:ATP-dependent RNA helicase DHX29